MNARRQQGVALILVLWVLVLITVATGAFTLMARADRLEAHQLLGSVRARLAAEAGIHLAAVVLRDPNPESRWFADGRVQPFEIDGVLVELQITDERGKIDVNVADEPTMMQLFMGHGLDQAAAEQLAAAVIDWRDADELERPNGAEMDTYLAMGLGVGPANRPFVVMPELLQVLGMTYELYQRIEPGISLWSRSAQPDPAFAPVESLLSVPDITEEEAREFVARRHELENDQLTSLVLPDGRSAMARGRGVTYSIEARATLPSGVWDTVLATIRLGGSTDGQPFRTLRWHEGYHR